MKTIIGETLKYSLDDMLQRQKVISKGLKNKEHGEKILSNSTEQEQLIIDLIKLVNRVYD